MTDLFNEAFLDGLTERASELKFAEIFAHTGYSELFEFHGGAVLSKKALRTGNPTIHILRFTQAVVDNLLKQQWLHDLQSEQHRFQYTRGVCDALMALDKEKLRGHLKAKSIINQAVESENLYDIMPAVAAAIGDTELLLRHIASHEDLYTSACKLFPTALEAAVASGHTDILSCMLSYLKNNVKGKPEVDSWDEMRCAARGISQALRVAIRLHKMDAGNLIFDFLADNRVFSGSTSKYLGERLIKDCMTSGNGALIYGAFAYDLGGSYHSSDKGTLGKLPLDEFEESFLFKFGHPNALRHLIRNGQFDPNKWAQYRPPLNYALAKRRYDMARVLLENGADVDARTKKLGGKTALWQAAEQGYINDVKLLLEHGAQPSHEKRAFSPLYATGYRKCRFLLLKVMEHGKEYLSRPDLWQIYDEES